MDAASEAVPSDYTDPQRVANLLKTLGKSAAAAHVEKKLSTQTDGGVSCVGSDVALSGPSAPGSVLVTALPAVVCISTKPS